VIAKGYPAPSAANGRGSVARDRNGHGPVSERLLPGLFPLAAFFAFVAEFELLEQRLPERFEFRGRIVKHLEQPDLLLDGEGDDLASVFERQFELSRQRLHGVEQTYESPNVLFANGHAGENHGRGLTSA
jgi:hypothetical protein